MNNIDKQQRGKIKEILDENPSLSEEAIANVSKAAQCIFLWINAIYQYSVIYSEILQPKEIHDDIITKEEKSIEKLDENTKELTKFDFAKQFDLIEKSLTTELKSFQKPPKEVEITLQCACILLNKEPTWEESKKLLSDPNLMDYFKNYEKRNIEEEQIEKIHKIFELNPTMNADSVKKICMGAGALFSWVKWLCDNHGNSKKYQKENELLQKESEEEEKLNELEKNIINSKAEKNDETDPNLKVLLEKAETALFSISKSQISQIFCFGNPPSLIALTFYLVRTLLDNKIKKVEEVVFFF